MAEGSWCMSCGNNPQKVKCPDCGREPQIKQLGELGSKQVGLVMTAAPRTEIPDEYINNLWLADKFWRSHSGEKFLKGEHREVPNRMLHKYVEDLDRINDYFAAGKLPNRGAFIISPSLYGKDVLAYSCMQLAIAHGYSVAPILDTLELKRFLVLAAENPSYKYHKKWDYDDYITSDVLFIRVTKIDDYKKIAYSVILEIISRRSRQGLGTFVLSNDELDVLGRYDKSGNFNRMKNASPADNFKKYLTVIRYNRG